MGDEGSWIEIMICFALAGIRIEHFTGGKLLVRCGEIAST